MPITNPISTRTIKTQLILFKVVPLLSSVYSPWLNSLPVSLSSIRLFILSQKASSVHKFSRFYFALFLQDSYFLAGSTLPALAVLLSRFPSAATTAGISKCRTWHAARSVHPENIRHMALSLEHRQKVQWMHRIQMHRQP